MFAALAVDSEGDEESEMLQQVEEERRMRRKQQKKKKKKLTPEQEFDNRLRELFPPHVWVRILQYLPPHFLEVMEHISRMWKALIRLDSVLLQRRWGAAMQQCCFTCGSLEDTGAVLRLHVLLDEELEGPSLRRRRDVFCLYDRQGALQASEGDEEADLGISLVMSTPELACSAEGMQAQFSDLAASAGQEGPALTFGEAPLRGRVLLTLEVAAAGGAPEGEGGAAAAEGNKDAGDAAMQEAAVAGAIHDVEVECDVEGVAAAAADDEGRGVDLSKATEALAVGGKERAVARDGAVDSSAGKAPAHRGEEHDDEEDAAVVELEDDGGGGGEGQPCWEGQRCWEGVFYGTVDPTEALPVRLMVSFSGDQARRQEELHSLLGAGDGACEVSPLEHPSVLDVDVACLFFDPFFPHGIASSGALPPVHVMDAKCPKQRAYMLFTDRAHVALSSMGLGYNERGELDDGRFHHDLLGRLEFRSSWKRRCPPCCQMPSPMAGDGAGPAEAAPPHAAAPSAVWASCVPPLPWLRQRQWGTCVLRADAQPLHWVDERMEQTRRRALEEQAQSQRDGVPGTMTQGEESFYFSKGDGGSRVNRDRKRKRSEQEEREARRMGLSKKKKDRRRRR